MENIKNPSDPPKCICGKIIKIIKTKVYKNRIKLSKIQWFLKLSNRIKRQINKKIFLIKIKINKKILNLYIHNKLKNKK